MRFIKMNKKYLIIFVNSFCLFVTGVSFLILINAGCFSALPAGFRHYIGAYGELGTETNFWSSTAINDTIPVVRQLEYNSAYVDRFGSDNRNGYSIRCVRDY